METLPPELLEQIVRHLSPQDLVTCSAVSRSWHEIVNQDWLWKPHCDPELEEHLRTTPCVVEPGFVTPEVGNSSLTPSCKWKLAFMREEHLWRNWKHANVRKEELQNSGHQVLYTNQFLTNTLLVNVSRERQISQIEIWDVSVIPASLVATTSLGRMHCSLRSTVGSNWIIVNQFNPNSIIILFVDITKKCIYLKHNIRLYGGLQYFVTKQKSVDGRMFILMARRTDLIIYDLETGEEIKRVCCPVVENQHGSKQILQIYDIPTSDDILVIIENKQRRRNFWTRKRETVCTFLPYIYSLKEQLYLPGSITEALTSWSYPLIIDHYVCLYNGIQVVIVDYHTSETLFKSDGQLVETRLAFNDYFIFVDTMDGINYCLKVFSIMSKSITHIVLKHELCDPLPQFGGLSAVGNRFLILYGKAVYDILLPSTPVAVFEPFGQSLKKVDAHCPDLSCSLKINKASTRCFRFVENKCYMYCFW